MTERDFPPIDSPPIARKTLSPVRSKHGPLLSDHFCLCPAFVALFGGASGGRFRIKLILRPEKASVDVAKDHF